MRQNVKLISGSTKCSESDRCVEARRQINWEEYNGHCYYWTELQNFLYFTRRKYLLDFDNFFIPARSMTFCNSTTGARSPMQTGVMLKPFATREVATWRQSSQMPQTTISWRRRLKGFSTNMFGLEAQTEKRRAFGGGQTAVPGSSRSGIETNQTMAE